MLQAENRKIRARYDSAQTTTENRRHWAAADGLSANASNSDAVRKLLRERARYEVANNSHAMGIGLTLANDTIGTGPRLQLNTDRESDNERVEGMFSEWADQIDLAGKLRTMRMAKFVDGEAFALFVTNRSLSPRGIQLDLRLIESDRVTNPFGGLDQPVDGIDLDEIGNPVTYHVLRDHPGDVRMNGSWESVQYPRRDVLHYFGAVRPEQSRGVPEITPALHLFAQLRRYTLAVIAAAEVAADNSAVLEGEASPTDEGDEDVAAMDTFQLTQRMVTTLPKGWKLAQMKAEQPTTTYSEFCKRIINEAARCLNMPYNVAAGNSEGYNYASGRLDHQVYFRSLRIERTVIERAVLRRVFARWLFEASLIEGFLPQSLRTIRPSVPHDYFWDGAEHVDPEKEANAQETRLRTGMTSEAEEYGCRGKDWRAERKQRLIEKIADLEDQAILLKEANRLGLPEPAVLQDKASLGRATAKKASIPQEDTADV